MAPLYVTIDKAYIDWWERIKERPLIPYGRVLPVHHALQGYPESFRLWSNMIDNISISNGFVPIINEPCLYSTTIDGHKVFFLRQVDDFAVSVPTQEITVKFFVLNFMNPLKFWVNKPL